MKLKLDPLLLSSTWAFLVLEAAVGRRAVEFGGLDLLVWGLRALGSNKDVRVASLGTKVKDSGSSS